MKNATTKYLKNDQKHPNNKKKAKIKENSQHKLKYLVTNYFRIE